MSKVVITISDTDEDNGVGVEVDFHPPIEAQALPTPSQALAFHVMDLLREDGGNDKIIHV